MNEKTATISTAPVQRSLGPILLAPGVAPSQIVIFLLIMTAIVCMGSFAGLMQPFLFSEMLKAPASEHGRLAGLLTTTQYLGVLAFITIAGIMADRIGRRACMIFAVAGMTALLFVYPFVTGLVGLVLLRFCWGGISTGFTVGGAAMMADYPDNNSRGKLYSIQILAQAIVGAVLVGGVLSRIPSWLIASGQEPILAGRMAFWAMGAFGLAGTALAFFFLKQPPRGDSPTTAPPPARRRGVKGLIADFAAVWEEARRNTKFGVVMVVGFVVRSDMQLVSNFLSVWVVASALQQGVTAAEALKTAGSLSVVLMLVTGVAPMFFGWVADRVDRTAMLLISILFTGIMLASTLLVNNVFGPLIYVVITLIGFGESALAVSSQAMFGESAPAHMRGAAMGVYSFTGTVSIVIISALGGYLFDAWSHAAPFLLLAVLNIGFALIAGPLIWRNKRKQAAVAA